MSLQRSFVGKLLDAMLYAPIGVAVAVREDVPALIDSGRTKVHDRVQVARWVGEMAVTYGRQEIERRLTAAAQNPVLEPVVHTPLAAISAHEPSPPPFEGYDHLAAAQIVQLLSRLPHAELVLVQDYEVAHRARRTILAKLDQLLAP